MSLLDRVGSKTRRTIGFALVVAFLLSGAISGCSSSNNDSFDFADSGQPDGSDGSNLGLVPQPEFPASAFGYFSAGGVTGIPTYGPDPFPFPGGNEGPANVWICFYGDEKVRPTTLALCPDSKSSTKAPPPGVQVFASVGGGVNNSLTAQAVNGLATPCPAAGQYPCQNPSAGSAAAFQQANFQGVFFDMESLSGWTTYAAFETSMAAAVAALKKQGLISILSTAKDGWNTAALQNSWPEGWNADNFTTFQATIVPLFDVYSPQCYTSGHDSILFACRPTVNWDYSGYKSAQRIWPAISANWITKNAAAGMDPVAVLNGLGPASCFPPERPVSGFLVWNAVGPNTGGEPPEPNPTPTANTCSPPTPPGPQDCSTCCRFLANKPPETSISKYVNSFCPDIPVAETPNHVFNDSPGGRSCNAGSGLPTGNFKQGGTYNLSCTKKWSSL